jgi:predicted transcriptional regulator
MIRNYGDEDRRSVLSEVHVTASTVQQILEACIIESAIGKLTKNIRDLSYCDLKKYLFYLITFGLISYHGERRKYQITEKGFILLLIINDSERNPSSGNEDIVIHN